MTEYGEVVDIKGNTAYVKFHRTSACGKCGACGLLSNQNEIVVEMENELNVSAGDYVSVEITMKKALKASAIAYIVPLVMLILGVVFGWLLSGVWGVFPNTDVTMAICGIIFAILSFLLLKVAYPLYNKTVTNVYRMVDRKQDKDNETK
jgi:sigma-E factor negative regulatory protein RseC